MEGLRSRFSKLRIPAYQEIRSGEFFRKLMESEQTEENSNYLLDFENKLIYMQEVVIWTDVQRSALWLLASQIFLYQFCLSTTPVLSTVAQLALVVYMYNTWTHKIWPAIRIPEGEMPQDVEKWTSVHPDTYSAPELQQLCTKARHKIIEIYRGVWLLRSEEPLKFCITMSTFFISTAILGVKVSTPVLIHSVALLAFLLPPLLIHLSRNDQVKPVLLLVGEIIISISNSLVYHGNKQIVKEESPELDEFLPEDSALVRDKLELTPCLQKQSEDSDLLDSQLEPQETIPSHEDLDLLESPGTNSRMIEESDLIPAAAIVDHTISDDDDDIMIPSSEGRLINLDTSDSDSDEFSLRGSHQAVIQEAASESRPIAVSNSSSSTATNLSSSVTSSIVSGSMLEAASAYLPTVNSASAYIPQVLGNLVATATASEPSQSQRKTYRSGNSEASLEDFELISEEDLEKESQHELLD